MLRYKQKLDLV